jgi:hypothetical protein
MCVCLSLVGLHKGLALLLLGGGVASGGALLVLLLLHLEGQLALEVPDGAVLVGGAGLRVDPAPTRHVHVQLLVFNQVQHQVSQNVCSYCMLLDTVDNSLKG